MPLQAHLILLALLVAFTNGCSVAIPGQAESDQPLGLFAGVADGSGTLKSVELPLSSATTLLMSTHDRDPWGDQASFNTMSLGLRRYLNPKARFSTFVGCGLSVTGTPDSFIDTSVGTALSTEVGACFYLTRAIRADVLHQTNAIADFDSLEGNGITFYGFTFLF
ncbi:MAG: hypothetical protein HOM34_09885 [Planctomycetes bacterium]|jgi:hypothetical protein|nr:hypothetical protein [Planctomycetota bacterium]MBT5121018.1 hypothetical protein [Planctomycetota bacterium]MBT7319162.1 hypothetical protein [Planctomycetota bacterium]